MTVAVVQFSGSNCDRDTRYIFENVLQVSCSFVWQDETSLPAHTKGVILPGGFSFGDYLRTGVMAAHRPIMTAVRNFVEKSGPVIGICNGFQILCEAKILPGALLTNSGGEFICRNVRLRVTGGGQGALRAYKKDEEITLPVAHHDGRFFARSEELQRIKDLNLIALQYTQIDEDGVAILNGSCESIAGIFGGPSRNVLGLMPHPERRSEEIMGGNDGLRMLQSLIL